MILSYHAFQSMSCVGDWEYLGQVHGFAIEQVDHRSELTDEAFGAGAGRQLVDSLEPLSGALLVRAAVWVTPLCTGHCGGCEGGLASDEGPGDVPEHHIHD